MSLDPHNKLEIMSKFATVALASAFSNGQDRQYKISIADAEIDRDGNVSLLEAVDINFDAAIEHLYQMVCEARVGSNVQLRIKEGRFVHRRQYDADSHQLLMSRAP